MKLENVLHVATEIEAAGSSPPEVRSDCKSKFCLSRVESLKAILIQARTRFSSNIYVGLSRELDLRISLHACEAWRAGQ